MSRIEENQALLTNKLDENAIKTQEIFDILNAAKSFFNFAEKMGTAIKWSAGILAPALSLWYTIKNGSK